jgi:hypothetical protein
MSRVYPHGGIEELAPGLWQVTGSLGRSPLPRNMVIFRLASGGLLIHSGVAMNGAGMAALEALGAPEVLIVPNGYHRSDASWYTARYPRLEVVCPAAARGRVERVVKVTGEAETSLPQRGVTCHVPGGIRPSELAYELTLKSGRALVFTDLLFNLGPLPGISGRMLALLGSSGFFGMTRIGRWMLLREPGTFRSWLLQMAELPGLKVICVAHGAAVTSGCGARLKDAAARIRA